MDKATGKNTKGGLEWKMGNLYQKAVEALNRGKNISEEELMEAASLDMEEGNSNLPQMQDDAASDFPDQLQEGAAPDAPSPSETVLKAETEEPKPEKEAQANPSSAELSKEDPEYVGQVKGLKGMDQNKPKTPVQTLSDQEILQRNKETITFNLFFSADKMTAYIRAQNYQKGKEADNRIPSEVIYNLLKTQGVVFGIDHNGIEEYCKGKIFYKDFPAAEGIRPQNGQDGSVEYMFSLDMTYAPRERDDGTVDYKELDLIRNVEAGDPLCRIQPPTEGRDGMDIFGKTVKAFAGKPVSVNTGKGVEMAEDGMTCVASTAGMVELNNGTLEVKDVYTINGDVGPATGNIRFGGAVIIKGSVLADYAVYAAGDIIVNGYVESSILNSSGNIVIKNGISGTKKGLLKADGDVTVRFAEMARIVAGGSFHFDYCINCDVRVGDSIIGKGKRASLLGGNYIAGSKVDVNIIGSDLNIPMDVQIIPNWQEVTNLKIKPEERIRENKELANQYEQDYTALKKKYERIEGEIARLARRSSMDTEEEAEAKQKKVLVLMRQKAGLRDQLNYVDEKREKLKGMSSREDSRIVVRKTAHVGARLTIGNAMMWINNPMDHQTFVDNQGLIEAHSITPGSV